MKRLYFCLIAVLLVIVFIVPSFAIGTNDYRVRGFVYQPAYVHPTVTSSTATSAATALLTITTDIPQYVSKMFICKNPAGASHSVSFEVWASTAGTTWYSVDKTTFAAMAADTTKVLDLQGYPIERWKVTYQAITGGSTADAAVLITPECVFRGSTM